MLGALVLLFVAIPFVELFVLIQVGQVVGALPTVALLVAVSVAGAALVKREGIGLLRRARLEIEAGRVPGRELVDGVLILFAGALLLTPGFLTDILGLALLVPPVRVAIRMAVVRRLRRRADLAGPYHWR